MKKIFLITLIVCCIFALSACDKEDTSTPKDDVAQNTEEQIKTNTSNNEDDTTTTTTQNEDKDKEDTPKTDTNDQNIETVKIGEGENIATLYAVHSMGAVEGTGALIETYDYYYDDYLSIHMLADALSELTGLDFFLSDVTEDFETYTVSWADNSTLIANPVDIAQKEEFFFSDADSMRWFMMDSLYKTIMENIEAIEVFYMAEGGQELSFDELSPVNAFGTTVPYMGSSFYYNHADDVWEDVVIYDNTADQWSQGTWFLNGDINSDYIVLDTNSNFVSCYADGTVKNEGKFGYFAGSGRTTKYGIVDVDENIIDTFIYRSAITLLLENENLTYEKLHPNIPVITGATHFTGMTTEQIDNNHKGGYYYSDLTEDGMTKIINTGYASDFLDEPLLESLELPLLDEEAMNKYIEEQAKDLTLYNTYYLSSSDSTPKNLTITKDESLNVYSPAYILSWESGEGEEARKWDALFFDTYDYTYFYAFNTKAEFADDMKDVWLEQFDKLTRQNYLE